MRLALGARLCAAVALLLGTGCAVEARRHRPTHEQHPHHTHRHIVPPVNTYRAAAVQFTPSGTYADPPLSVIQQSIDRFAPFVQSAAGQGVQVIVFPEGALGMFNAENENTRDAMFPWCVEVGEVETTNPCTEWTAQPPEKNSTLYQLYTASCLAQSNKIILALNLCESRPCNPSSDPTCPEDGRFQWNTEVVFEETGMLVMKYHKTHLFGGSAVFDAALPVPTSFVSSFGVRFGSFVCFDIQFAHPAVDLVQQGVTDFLFSSWWVNAAPTMNALMAQQAWSNLYQVNLIAANTGATAFNSGGGIYTQGQTLGTLWESQQGVTGVNHMIVADVPRIDKKAQIASKKSIPAARTRSPASRAHSRSFLPLPYQPCQPNAVFEGVSANCTYFSAASVRAAAEAAGNVNGGWAWQLTQGNVTCVIEIDWTENSGTNSSETYVAMAYEGVQQMPDTPDPLSLQVCAVTHCLPVPAPGGGGAGEQMCLPQWTSFDTRVDWISLQASGMDSTAEIFPMLTVEDGQLLGSTAETQYQTQESGDGWTNVQWSTTAAFSNQSLSAMLIYAVRPPNGSTQ
jgi:predicted amidohydrolase